MRFETLAPFFRRRRQREFHRGNDKIRSKVGDIFTFSGSSSKFSSELKRRRRSANKHLLILYLAPSQNDVFSVIPR